MILLLLSLFERAPLSSCGSAFCPEKPLIQRPHGLLLLYMADSSTLRTEVKIGCSDVHHVLQQCHGLFNLSPRLIGPCERVLRCNPRVMVFGKLGCFDVHHVLQQFHGLFNLSVCPVGPCKRLLRCKSRGMVFGKLGYCCTVVWLFRARSQQLTDRHIEWPITA